MASQSKQDGSESLDIDPNGDLILDLSSPSVQRFMRVSSKTLCLASPVFRAMLAPSRFREGVALQTSTEENPAQIVLDEDDYDALLIIMNAMHLRTRQVPTTVTVYMFYQIAVLCNKYNLAEVLVPWVSMWTNSFPNIVETPGYEKWLLISWVFRQSKIFGDVTKKLILNTELGKDDLLKTPECDTIRSWFPSDSVIRSMRDKRAHIISTLISIFVLEMKRYNAGALSGQNICQVITRRDRNKRVPSNKRNKCDNICVGTLYRFVVAAGMWPKQTRADRRAAISISKDFELMEASGVEICENDIWMDHNSNTHSHCDCDPRKKIEIAVSSTFSKVQGLNLHDFLSKDCIFFPEEDEVLEVAIPPRKRLRLGF